MHAQPLGESFERYKAEPKRQHEEPSGILSAVDVGRNLVEMVFDGGRYPDGIYVLTAPGRRYRVEARQLL